MKKNNVSESNNKSEIDDKSELVKKLTIEEWATGLFCSFIVISILVIIPGYIFYQMRKSAGIELPPLSESITNPYAWVMLLVGTLPITIPYIRKGITHLQRKTKQWHK